MTSATEHQHRSLIVAIGVAACFVVPIPPAQAENEFVPELNTFLKLSSLTRLYMLVDLTGSRDGEAVLIELTGRARLPLDVWFVNRVRVDFRDLDGKHSDRYLTSSAS